MRVGLRRFRSALTVFGDLLPAAQLAWLQEEAKWALNALGSARDWDVFLADLLAPLEAARPGRSEEHTSELQSLMRISYAVFCLKKKKKNQNTPKKKPHIIHPIILPTHRTSILTDKNASTPHT